MKYACMRYIESKIISPVINGKFNFLTIHVYGYAGLFSSYKTVHVQTE